MNCVYTIRRAGNTATLLQTNRFHLESSETCGFDSLKVGFILNIRDKPTLLPAIWLTWNIVPDVGLIPLG